VYDVFVAPPAAAAAAAAKITGKMHAAARDAVYGPPPVTFETPSLAFESRFQVPYRMSRTRTSPLPSPPTPPPSTQCGNLWRAVRVGEELYELLMASDFNRRTKTCWFYFRVEGARKGVRYRLRIVNFEKSDSLFKQGQRVLCYSTATEQWFRVGGSHVSYLPNNIHLLHAASHPAAAADDDVAGGGECPQLYTLDFSFEPARDGDTLYFAPCFPYSVRDNAQHLAALQVPPTPPRIHRPHPTPILVVSPRRRVTCFAGQGARAGVVHVPVPLPHPLRPRHNHRHTRPPPPQPPSPSPPCRLHPLGLENRRHHHRPRASGRAQRFLDNAV